MTHPTGAFGPGVGASDAARSLATHDSRIFLETARQLGSSLEPDAIFARMKDSICGAMRCNGLIVSSFDRREQLIRCAYAWVGGNLLDPATLPPLVHRPDAEGMQTQVIRTGKPMMFADVAERVRNPRGTFYEVEPSGRVRDLKDTGPSLSHSAIMSPLILEGEVVGVLQVMADEEQAYTHADLELLEGISLLLAVALENARLFRRLQDELEERRRAERHLRETECALLEADQRKNEFLATLGHELRNPLNPIRSAVELLQRLPTPDRDARWAHDVIQRQVVHLARLMDDLLDVSRISQGKIELRRSVVSLDHILRSSVESLREILEGLRQQITILGDGSSLRVNADAVRLGQVFSNLLDNASKYTPPGGRIQVCVEREGLSAVITFRDEGRGIAPEHLAHVFDLFYQAGPREAPGGLGIGLTLVKRLVELHGGTIHAASSGMGCGSDFTVRLPLEDAEIAIPAPESATPPKARGWRLLVADDNQDSAEILAMVLRTCGHDVRVAFDGENALAVAEDFRPEALVLDIGMPRVDGHEVARRLRAEDWGKQLILVAATGWGQEQDRERSLSAGFDAHLVKPVDHESLMRVIGEIATSRG